MRRRRNRSRSQPNLLGPLFTVTAKLLLSLVLVGGVAELAAAVVLERLDRNPPEAMPRYRPEDVARLYDTTDYRLYLDALAETWRAAHTVYQPFVETKMAPFAGRHVAIDEAGIRAGDRPYDPQGAGSKVFVFGGSTTFGIGVPGNETLPAFLEKALREAGKEVQVANFGTLGHYSTPERILLERLLVEGHKPEVAVFVDGLGDFLHCHDTERGSSSEQLRAASRLGGHTPLTEDLAEHSQVGRLLRALAGGAGGTAGAADPCADEAAAERAARRLDANRRMIAGLAERMGVKVLFVQQPVPGFHYDNARRPVMPRPAALVAAGGDGTRRLAELRAAGELWTENLLWLAELEPAEGNAYIDAVHYSPRFNKAIAEAAARHILESRWLP